jgi:RimJ/RimL family protein N-acetyltransferase
MGANDEVATVEPFERLGLRFIAMTPTRAPALTRFHETLTAATTHSRFFAVHPHLSPAELIRFTTVDHQDREALVALDDDGEIVAVARFDRLSGSPSVAEVAFVVADAWQHHGVGTALFARLASQAAELGVEQFVAETFAGNRAMRAVFRHSGYAVTEQLDDGIIRLTIELSLGCSPRGCPRVNRSTGGEAVAHPHFPQGAANVVREVERFVVDPHREPDPAWHEAHLLAVARDARELGGDQRQDLRRSWVGDRRRWRTNRRACA